MYYIEMTDTFGGEANYSWVHHFMVSAKTPLGAIRKVTRHTGYPARKAYDTGDLIRYNVPNACICYFLTAAAEGQEYYINALQL